MRILLTGVSGQVGGALRPSLQSHEVIAPDETVFDLTDTGQIAERLDSYAPELIINPAAYTAVDKAEDEPERAYLINAVAAAAIARWAAAHDVPLVHFSTDYVFDGSGDRPRGEDDIANPLSVYGASKLAGDEAIQAAGGPSIILRTSWVYAAKGANFLRTIARLARDRRELRIVDDQVGAPTSAALLAGVVADMLVDGIDAFRRRSAQAGGLVHVCAAGETTWYGFAAAIVAGLKGRKVALMVENIQPIVTADYPTRARRPQNSRLDLARLRDVFGIKTMHWAEALAPELDLLAEDMLSGDCSRGRSRN
jgi:dTDP-4-dehydrorhamnose reductase